MKNHKLLLAISLAAILSPLAKADVAGAAHSVKETTVHAAHKTGEIAREAAHGTAHAAKTVAHGVADTARKGYQATKQAVHKVI